jgi:hypothetical protein
MPRDVRLAKAAVDVVEAATDLTDILDDAESYGWGFEDDEGTEWPKDRVNKAQHALVLARAAFQKLLTEGDYLDENDEWREV